MRSTKYLASLLMPVAMVLLPGPSVAREACSGTVVDVMITAASPREIALVCAGAKQAWDLLAICGIAPHGAIDIRIRPEVRHPLAGLIFGYYDLGEKHVVLTSLHSLAGLMQDTPYAELPADDFYQSLVVHEVVHNVMHQTLASNALSHAAYEYPAYALQIASLPAATRSAFLKAFDQGRIEHASSLNDTILSFAPYLFAARAYTHFAASGCASIRATMIHGDASFDDVRTHASPPLSAPRR
jgi:hypothetical protein